jgi:hypothetical protein
VQSQLRAAEAEAAAAAEVSARQQAVLATAHAAAEAALTTAQVPNPTLTPFASCSSRAICSPPLPWRVIPGEGRPAWAV